MLACDWLLSDHVTSVVTCDWPGGVHAAAAHLLHQRGGGEDGDLLRRGEVSCDWWRAVTCPPCSPLIGQELPGGGRGGEQRVSRHAEAVSAGGGAAAAGQLLLDLLISAYTLLHKLAGIF